MFFFFNGTATTEIYTLSLHDALPISDPDRARGPACPVHRAHRGGHGRHGVPGDRKSTRLNSSHVAISYAVFCLKKKKENHLLDLFRIGNLIGSCSTGSMPLLPFISASGCSHERTRRRL